MNFELKVNYRAPSKERLFLGRGWSGVRDVRGPYLCAPTAEIIIGNWALSPSIPSEITLALSMSHRAEVDALTVDLIGIFDDARVMLSKIKPTTIVLPRIMANLAQGSVTMMLEPGFGNGPVPSPGRTDLVALDEIQIKRPSGSWHIAVPRPY